MVGKYGHIILVVDAWEMIVISGHDGDHYSGQDGGHDDVHDPGYDGVECPPRLLSLCWKGPAPILIFA